MDDFLENIKKHIFINKAKTKIMEDLLEDAKRKFKQIESENPVSELPMDIKSSILMNSTYPTGKGITLLDKFRHLEDKTGKIWNKKEMLLYIEENEGNKKSVKSFHQAIQKYIKQKLLISLKYNNSNKYTFYCTRKDWIDVNNNELIKEHEPESDELKYLNDDQKKNIVFNGI